MSVGTSMLQQPFNKYVEDEVEIKQNFKNKVSLRTHLKLGVTRPTLKSIQPKNINKEIFGTCLTVEFTYSVVWLPVFFRPGALHVITKILKTYTIANGGFRTS